MPIRRGAWIKRFLEKKNPILIHYIFFSIRMIFNKFLEAFKWFFEKVKVSSFQKTCYFKLESKNKILILWSFDFFYILFESKWGVFPYLHFCLK